MEKKRFDQSRTLVIISFQYTNSTNYPKELFSARLKRKLKLAMESFFAPFPTPVADLARPFYRFF